jgi:hypothetical protein
LRAFGDSFLGSNRILSNDLNIILSLNEKQGDSFSKYPLREIVDELLTEWDIFNPNPKKGKYTWTNRRFGLGHIAERLDQFLL